MSLLPRGLREALRHLLAVPLLLVTLTAPAAAQQLPFAEEIHVFAVEDEANPPRGCESLFVGSSSFRFWFTIQSDFPDRRILKRGFGGARIADINLHFDRVVGRYHPKQIVFYAGENDLNGGRSIDAVLGDFEVFLYRKRAELGATPVYFVSVKPSPSRWGDFARQTEFNRRIEALAARADDLEYIDIVAPMMQGGTPRPELFISDRLHMNAAGYAIWRERIESKLGEQDGADKQRCEMPRN